MQDRWTQKNVDLRLLCERIENFFRSRDLEISKRKLVNGYEISVTRKPVNNTSRKPVVRIFGNSNDFTVDVSSNGHASISIAVGRITTLFGGGSFFLRGLKSRDAQEKMERELWIYLQKNIADLVNSGSPTE